MRIAVVGTSGSGKTTLAGRLAAALDLAHIELDQINWQPGWVGLNATDEPEFIRRVEAAVAQPAWVCAGNYGAVREVVWRRATHVVWLDYPRRVVMRRVLWRSLLRAIDRRELWPGTGNRENPLMWIRSDHPIRYAWTTHARRRRQYGERIADPRWAHLMVHHLRRPKDADAVIEALRAEAAHGPL